eukprot:TRINITY_DN94616_c0_g1_i1.p1 TRINITY_DN94616_c0_g1~~TRINITY_DN94616_c0_g1_i1.p1  ORF type:complete len:461 (-),score=103.93 TRINITY_DN94616_c0_g1_i1:360-1742(-)
MTALQAAANVTKVEGESLAAVLKDSADGCDASSTSTTASTAEESEKEQSLPKEDPPAPARARLPPFPVPSSLEGLKSRRRPVLSLVPEATTGSASSKDGLAEEAGRSSSSSAVLVEVSMVSRVSLVGLEKSQRKDLLNQLKGIATELPDNSWKTWLHDGLKIAVIIDEDGGPSFKDQFEAAVALSPHVVCVEGSCLQGKGGACALLKAFKGGILLLERGSEGSSDEQEAEVAILHALGVSARFRSDSGGLEKAEIPEPLIGEVIGDLRLKDLAAKPDLGALAEEAQPLYDEHFHADLLEDLEGWEGSQLGLLVSSKKSKTKAASKSQKDVDDDKDHSPELLGLIVYKFWGPPLRAMSVLRVAVPQKYRMQGFGRQLMKWAMDQARHKPRHECARVTLCAMPEAIPFYERLQFSPIPEEEDPQAPPQDEESKPPPSVGARMPGAIWMEHKCGRSFKPNSRR